MDINVDLLKYLSKQKIERKLKESGAADPNTITPNQESRNEIHKPTTIKKINLLWITYGKLIFRVCS